MSTAQDVAKLVKEQFGLDCEVFQGPCEGLSYFDWDTTGEYGIECSKMGVARPHLDGGTFCDRHNRELS